MLEDYYLETEKLFLFCLFSAVLLKMK